MREGEKRNRGIGEGERQEKGGRNERRIEGDTEREGDRENKKEGG